MVQIKYTLQQKWHLLIPSLLLLSACMPQPSGGPCDYEVVTVDCQIKSSKNEGQYLCELKDKPPSNSATFESMSMYDIYDDSLEAKINDIVTLELSVITRGTCTPINLRSVTKAN